jgi:hypothetical protein
MMIPGPLTFNVREWRMPRIPKLECGELAGNSLPTRHRARLWLKVAPRLGDDLFIKLFSHGAPEKNAIALLDEGGLDRTLEYLKAEASNIGAEIIAADDNPAVVNGCFYADLDGLTNARRALSRRSR